MSKILILEARFYDHIADGLLSGVKAVLADAGYSHDIVTVPGIYELPAALTFALDAIEAGRWAPCAGFITLGCAIRGESDHYHYISQECMRGLVEISATRRIALGNGVLTVHSEAQALRRSDPAQKNIGGLAAKACLAMVALRKQTGIAS